MGKGLSAIKFSLNIKKILLPATSEYDSKREFPLVFAQIAKLNVGSTLAAFFDINGRMLPDSIDWV